MRKAVVLSAVAVAGALWTGCDAKQQTEYIAAVSTQVKVPRDLQMIRFTVSQGGVTVFCRGYRVFDGKVLLPRSLGTFAAESARKGELITYNIIGYTTPLAEGDEFDDSRCSDQVGENGARVLKRSRQPYITDEIHFLPLPLKYSCFDKAGCGLEETCKGGRCVSATIASDEATARLHFPRYLPELEDGSGAACFSSSQCLAAATPAVTVDAASCTYAVANSKDQPPTIENLPSPIQGPSSGEGVNVEIAYDGGYNREVLDLEPDEGFVIPDPAKPQQFRLAPGLCDMVKGYDAQNNILPHRITAIRASGTCRSKVVAQPLCAGDALAAMGADPQGNAPAISTDSCKPLELKPPKAALVVVVDDTVKHGNFFKEAGERALDISFADPAFEKTDIGLVYSPGSTTPVCGGTFAGVEPELARTARFKITDSLTLRKPLTPGGEPQLLQNAESPFLAGALGFAYAKLNEAKYATYFRKAVVVIGNRKFDEDTCAPTPTARATAARAVAPGQAAGIQTYVFAFTVNPDNPADSLDGPPPVDADALANAGGTGNATGAKGSNKLPALERFQDITNSLATCVYELPGLSATQTPQNSVLAYSHPILGGITKIPFDASCNGEGAPGNGFGVDGVNRVYVCGNACTAYREVLKQTAAFSNVFGQPPIAVPIYIHQAACAP